MCGMLYESEMLWRSQVALGANNNDDAVIRIMRLMIPTFYADKHHDVIIDKGFYWGLADNLDLLRRFAPMAPKFIVMDRDWDSVVESHVKMFLANPSNRIVNRDMVQPFTAEAIASHLTTSGGPLDLCRQSRDNILATHPQDAVVVRYERLCAEPAAVVAEIYDLLGLPRFEHWYTGIRNANLDNDEFWGIPGMHTIRPDVGV